MPPSAFLHRRIHVVALTYLPSSDKHNARILSVCPTSLLMRFPLLGSQSLTTRSGLPLAMTVPYGSVASAYIEPFGPEPSGAVSESSGGGDAAGSDELDVREGSQILIVRSNEPEASHWRSRL